MRRNRFACLFDFRQQTVRSLVKRAAFFGQTLRPLDESYAKALLQFDDLLVTISLS